MKRLNICVDIDGTITDPYCWLDYANKYFSKNVKIEDINVYDIEETMGITREAFAEFYSSCGIEMHLNAPLRDDKVKNVLEQLSKNHNIYYVTAREDRMTETTRKWIKENKLPRTKLFMLGSHYKVDKARELNCDIFIEDRYENAVQLANAGINVLLIDCRYNRYNLPERIIRVFNWNEVLENINILAKSILEDEGTEIA